MRKLALLAALAAVALVPSASAGTSALHLVKVGQFDGPVYATAPASQPGVLYVVEQKGVVMVLDHSKVRATPFLDLHASVKCCGEQGLLSIAFDPSYTANHFVYVSYTALDGDQRVSRFRTNGTTVIPSSQRILLDIKDVAPNHNGGQLQFGPDGDLYWGNGDGGNEGDPLNLGQNLSRPFARIIKVNVRATKPVWQLVAYGLRNPWRFSFDRATGDLYIGDVGQDKWEEIDYLKKGFAGIANFGWKRYEGDHIYDASVKLAGKGRYVPPILNYSHQFGCAVDGGYVYRGKAVPSAVGRYFYGDDCSGTVWSLKVVNGRATSVRTEPFKVPGLSSFGEDAAGELYLMSVSGGGLYKLAG
jgi:glucose/arabinose dehydrogenase